MAPFIQLPGDSTGKLVETVTPALSSAGSTMHREVMALGDFGSTQMAVITSSGGVLAHITNPSTAVTVTNISTAVTVTNPSTAVNVVNTVTVVSASSGLIQISGFVVSMKTTNATAAAQTTVATTGDLLLAANSARHRLMVQNSGIIPVRLSLSTVMPTATAYHVSLSAGTVADNGAGAAYIDEMWRGGVSAITTAAGGTVVVTELTT